MCQHLCKLVWLHASSALSVSPGPRTLQGPRVCPAQEVQRLGARLSEAKRVAMGHKLILMLMERLISVPPLLAASLWWPAGGQETVFASYDHFSIYD